MSRNVLRVIIVFLVIAMGASIYFVYLEIMGKDHATVITVPNVLEHYIRIQKNEELSSSDFTLNGSNKEMNYYFDIYNFDDQTQEYSQIDLIPYVKIELSNDQNIENLFSVNLYYIKDINNPTDPANLEEITTKMTEGKFIDNYECKVLKKYNKDSVNNVVHYVAKVTLNTENEEYTNLTSNLSESFNVTLGYVESK